jgi:hypothetical protein
MRNVLLFTFNCAKLPQAEFPKCINNVLPVEKPDLIVFGFQELLSIYDSTFQDYVLDYLSEISSSLISGINSHYGSGVGYVLAKLHSFGSVGQIVLVKDTLIDEISSVSVKETSFGIALSNLKSSVLISFQLDAVKYSFITAHLSAHEGIGNFEKRNQDFWNSIRNSESGNKIILEEKGHIFYMGDLNYRALRYDENEDNASPLEENDELKKALELKLAFVGFKEPEIKFKPTYKFHLDTNEYDRKRTPSWCDRILYRKYDNDDEDVICYDSLMEVKTSDHKPVVLHIKVPSNPPTKAILKDGELINNENGLRLNDPWFHLKQESGSVSTNLIKLGLFSYTTPRGRIITTGILSFILLYWIFD